MSEKNTKSLRMGLIVLIVVLAFVASYQIAIAGERDSSATAGSADSAGPSTDGSSLPCACCGGGADAPAVEGSATVEGDVQRITIDTSAGYYDPNVITLTAGVPAEITFTQAGGCLAQVESPDFGFSEDLTSGDVTVRLEAEQLTPGTYSFNCGMQMVFGTIIVE